MLALLSIGAAAAAATALASTAPARATSASPTSYRDVGAFAARIVRLMGQDRYDVAWLYLHPAHREAAPLMFYVPCELASPVPPVGSVQVLSVKASSVRVPGLEYPEPGYSVSLRTKFVAPPMAPVFVRHIVHVVPIEGRYTWILPKARYDAYAVGHCP